MTFEDAISETSPQTGDREPIRIQFAHDKLGIAAALREAFAAAANDRSDHDFGQQLRPHK
jgi:hypothetical protein